MDTGDGGHPGRRNGGAAGTGVAGMATGGHGDRGPRRRCRRRRRRRPGGTGGSRRARLHEQPGRLPVPVPGSVQAARGSHDEPAVAADGRRKGQPALREPAGHHAPGDSALHDVHRRAARRRLVEGGQHRPGARRRDAVPAGVRAGAVVGSGGAAHRRRHDGRRVTRLLRALERSEPVLHRHRHPRAA